MTGLLCALSTFQRLTRGGGKPYHLFRDDHLWVFLFSVSYLLSTVMRLSTRHYSMRLLLLPPHVNLCLSEDVPINCSVCLLTLRTHPTINTDFFQDPRAIWWQSVHLLKWRSIMSQSKSDNKVASSEHFRSMARKLPQLLIRLTIYGQSLKSTVCTFINLELW